MRWPTDVANPPEKQRVSQARRGRRPERLTQRESEVLACLAEGQTNKAIAARLGISPRTVQKHLQRIYAKLNVEGRTAAAVLVLQPSSRLT